MQDGQFQTDGPGKKKKGQQPSSNGVDFNSAFDKAVGTQELPQSKSNGKVTPTNKVDFNSAFDEVVKKKEPETEEQTTGETSSNGTKNISQSISPSSPLSYQRQIGRTEPLSANTRDRQLPYQQLKPALDQIADIAKKQQQDDDLFSFPNSLSGANQLQQGAQPTIQKSIVNDVMAGNPDAITHVITRQQSDLSNQLKTANEKLAAQYQVIDKVRDDNAIQQYNSEISDLRDKQKKLIQTGSEALDKTYADKFITNKDQSPEIQSQMGTELRKQKAKIGADPTYQDQELVALSPKKQPVNLGILLPQMQTSGETNKERIATLAKKANQVIDNSQQQVNRVKQDYEFTNRANILNATYSHQQDQVNDLLNKPIVQQYLNADDIEREKLQSDPDIQSAIQISKDAATTKDQLYGLINQYPEVKAQATSQRVANVFADYITRARKGEFGNGEQFLANRNVLEGTKLNDDYEIKRVVELSDGTLTEDDVKKYASDARIPSYLGLTIRGFGDVIKETEQGLNRLTLSKRDADIQNAMIEETKYHAPESLQLSKKNINPDTILSTMFSTVGQIAAYGLEGEVAGELIGGASGLTRAGNLAKKDLATINFAEQTLPSNKLAELMVKMGVADNETNALGQIVTATSKAKNISGIFSSMYATSYENAYQEASRFTADENKRKEYANSMATANGLAMTILNPANLVSNAVSGLSKEEAVMNFIKSDVPITSTSVLKDRLLEIGKTTGLGAAQSLIPVINDQLAKSNIFDYHTSTSEFLDHALNTSMSMAIGILPLGVLGAAKKPSSDYIKSSLFEAGTQPESVRSTIEDNFNKGTIDNAEKNRQIQVVNTLSDLVSKVPDKNNEGKDLTQPEKNELVYRQLQNLSLQKKAEGGLKSHYEKEIAENDKAINDIMGAKEALPKPTTDDEYKERIANATDEKEKEQLMKDYADFLSNQIKEDISNPKIETNGNEETAQEGDKNSENPKEESSSEKTTQNEGGILNEQGAAETSETETAPLSSEETPPPISEPPTGTTIHFERPATELSHRGLQDVANEFSLPDVETRDRKTDIQLRQDAENTANDWIAKGQYGKNVEKLVQDAESGKILTDEQRIILEQHLANISKELREIKDQKSPEFDKKLAEIKRLKEAGERTRSEAGAALRVPMGGSRAKDLADFMVEEMDASGVDKLTEGQKEKATKEYEELKAANDAYQQKIAGLEAENTRLQAEKEIKKTKGTTKKSEKKDYKKEREEIFTSIKGKLKKSREELSSAPIPYAKELFAIAPDVAKLVKSYVEQGITELSEIVKNVHEALKDDIKGITEKDINDLIAGNYNEKKQSKSQIASTLRDLRDESKLINKLEALENGEEPKSENKKIERNRQITELRGKIKDFGDRKKAEENKIKEEQKAAEKAKVDAVKEEEKFIKDFEKEKDSEEKTKAKAKVDAAKKLASDLEKKTKSESALRSIKTRMANQIKELEYRLKTGDFDAEDRPANPPIKLDKEAKDLKDKLLKLKEERALRLMKEQYKDRTIGQKVVGIGGKLLNTGRVAKSSFDVSMPFKQGIWGLTKQLLSLPIGENKTFRSQRELVQEFGKMYQALASEKAQRRIMDEIHSSPRYELAQKSGLDIAEPESILSRQREDYYGPSYAEKIPFIGKSIKLGKGKNAPRIGGLVKASERAATTFVNTMKWNIFNQYADIFEKQGKTFQNSKALYEGAATYANQGVGRGKLTEGIERANAVTSRFIFSLRLQASRLQLMTYLINPKFYTKVPKEIRIAYLKDMTKFVAAGLTTLAIAHSMGLSVGLNPYSSNFGKVRVGETEYDIWGGFQQWATFLIRQVSGKKTNNSGDTEDINRGDLALRFARSKASPEFGSAINLLQEKDYVGQPTDIKKEGLNFINPLITQDIYQSAQDGGVKQALITAVLAAHGVSVQTYPN